MIIDQFGDWFRFHAKEFSYARNGIQSESKFSGLGKMRYRDIKVVKTTTGLQLY